MNKSDTGSELKVGLVGCGRIAQRHAQVISEIEGLSIGAVCDVKLPKAKQLGEQYSVPWCPDMDWLAVGSSLDLFAVLTPSGLHAEHACQLAKYGKPVIVEKPMALRVEDADRMINTFRNHNLMLFVVMQNRFNTPVQHLRRAFVAGRFGQLVLGTVRVRWCRRQDYYDQDDWRSTWRMAGGVLANQASHHVDLLQWFMGEPQSVKAYSVTALANIEVEDTMVATVHFQNGALGVVEATTAARPTNIEGSLSILGSGGTVEVGGFAVNKMRVWQFEHSEPGDSDALLRSENPPDVYGFGHRKFYEHVLACLRDEAQPLVDGWEGRKSVELTEMIYEACETGNEVKRGNHYHSRLGR